MLSGAVHRHRRHQHASWRHDSSLPVVVCTLSGAVLIFTVLRIKASLRRRQDVRTRLRRATSQTPSNATDRRRSAAEPSARRRYHATGNLRTMKILTCASVAFFLFWSPYVVVLLARCFLGSFKPPSAVEFGVMWLANSNSAVNVLIYSSTNAHFRRQCVLLASRLCCSRLRCVSSIERSTPGRPGNVPTQLPATAGMSAINVMPASSMTIPVHNDGDHPPLQVTGVGLSTINVQVPLADDINLPVEDFAISSRDTGGGIELYVAPSAQFVSSVDNTKQTLRTETLTFDETIVYS